MGIANDRTDCGEEGGHVGLKDAMLGFEDCKAALPEQSVNAEWLMISDPPCMETAPPVTRVTQGEQQPAIYRYMNGGAVRVLSHVLCRCVT